MESKINNFGSYLEDYVENDKREDAGKLIKYVRKYVDDNVEDSCLNFIISKVFDEPYNLIKFLTRISHLSQRIAWKDVLSASLDLLDHFLKNFYQKVQEHVLEILKSCHNISMSNAQANEKVKSLKILCFIINKDSNIPADTINNIYNDYVRYCTVCRSKTASKVLKNVFILLGIISHKCPENICNQSTLFDIYINQLKYQSNVSQNDRDKIIVSGCIDGLSNILESFPEISPESRAKIFEIVKKLLFSGSTSFDIRGVVEFVSRHCSKIIHNILMDSLTAWEGELKKWLAESGEDNRKAGYNALEAFYSELARLLENENDTEAKENFQNYYKYFLEMMKNKSASTIEVRLAIRGFGLFAGPCKTFSTKENLMQMFIIVVNSIQENYFLQRNPSIEQLEYLPDYIKCLSMILAQIGEYTFNQINSLQQVSILMIKTFPRLSVLFHSSVFESLIISMCYLQQHDSKSLKDYLERVVYHGVLWTCSHRTTFDADLQEDENDKTITYKNYLPLWKIIINFSNSSSNKYNNIPIHVKKIVIQMVYDELIKTLLLLINKLNLNTKLRDDVPIVDPENICEAENRDDFVIFINLVDFYFELLPTVDGDLFKKWIKMFTSQVMTKSYYYPFVSGFYKLLRLALQLSEKINYFDEPQLKKQESRQMCHRKICSYLENIVSCSLNFKDDLQVACLELLLTVPLSFVPELLPSMIPVFQMAFTVGRGYLKLAETAVDSLDKWCQILPFDDLKPLLKNVLPNLDPFLRSKGFSGDPDIKLSLLQAKESKRSKSKRKVLIQQDSELENLQYKILMFIGQLNSEMCKYLIENIEVDQVTWDKEPYLKFTVPYNEVKPNIYLDKLLPRVLHLALTSGDQKTRITACCQMSLAKLQQRSKLFRKIMLPLIQLACDSNNIVRQLFNPLVYQMIHWYSSPLQMMSNETAILIDVLMEGLSHPNNTSMRDLSGKCLKEFVKWTIKQSRKEDLEQNSQNIKAVVQKLCLFAVHPSSSKRFGAALAFNHLYSDLREENILIGIYWIELMYSLMISMSFEDFKSKNMLQLDSALNHIERVLREKNSLFNKYSLDRKVPAGIEGPLLKDSVLWILKQTASLNTVYRRKSIKLFCNLAPYVDSNCGSLNNFLTKYVTNEKWFIQQYESNGLGKMVTLSSWENFGTIETIFQWFKYLLRCLDAYKYLLDYKIIDYNILKENNKINDSIKYYLEYVSTFKLEDTLKLLQNYNKDLEFLLDELEKFVEWKRLIVIGVLDFLLSIKSTTWFDSLCDETFWKFFCNCVFQPNILGFDATDNTNNVLMHKLTEIFQIFDKNLPVEHLTNLCDYLCTHFKNNYDENMSLESYNISMNQRSLLKGWLFIQKSDLRDKLPGDCLEYFTNSVTVVFSSIVKVEEDEGLLTAVKLEDTVEEYANLHLKLSLNISNSLQILCDCLTNAKQVKNPETFLDLTHGEYFLNYFKETIMEYILINHNEIIKKICAKWKNFDNITPLLIVINILKYLSDNRHLKEKFDISDFVHNVINNCLPVFETNKLCLNHHRDFQRELLTRIINVDSKETSTIGNRFPSMKKWFINQLTYKPCYENSNINLEFQTNILSFLHCFTGSDDQDDNILTSALQTFQKNLFPTSFNKIKNSDLIVLFKKLLDYLVISKSKIVLQSTIDIFTTIEYDEDNVNIHEALKQYLENITSDQQYQSIIWVYNHCCNQVHIAAKCKLVKIFLLTMLRFCHYNAFEKFFIQNIKTIIEKIKIKITQNSGENIIVEKRINLILIDVLFSRINVSNFVDKSCVITKAVFAENIITGYELLKECIVNIKDILKENLNFEDINIRELYRLYQCDAYNSLISVVCNSNNPKNDLTAYHVFFFKRNHVWKNLVDCNKQIVIPQDFDKLPKRKKVFINIRNEKKPKIDTQIHYIESQSLFNSTLSEDVCKFDFTNTLVRNVDMKLNNNNSTMDQSVGSILFEVIDYNNHECMATICGLINFMINKNVSPLPDDIKTAVLPDWMKDIKNILKNSEKNVRIFVARIVYNMQHIFIYYAKYFFEPVIQFIVDGCTGSTINYFIADLVEMLISWSDNVDLLEIKECVSKLVAYLMNKARNDRRDMMKYNLEIIKTSVEIWKTILNVPHEVIYQKYRHPEFNEKLVGVQLTGIILANGLTPWADTNINNTTETLIQILTNEKKAEIFKPTAEVIGMIICFLKNDKKTEPHLQLLFEQLEAAFSTFEINKFFHALEHMQIYFPSIIDKHIRKIRVHLYSQTDSANICICLKNILRSSDFDLTYKDVIDYLKKDVRDIQLLTLQIINKLILTFGRSQQISVMNAVYEFKTDASAIIRCAVYEILITVYNKYYEETDSESVELIKICKPVLLAAINDSDSELQEKIQEFWYDRLKSLKLSEKYERSLIDLYASENEAYFLGYVNFFLLHSCKDTPDYKKLLFEFPLSDCKFDDYQLMINWRAQHSSMAPMFANTSSRSEYIAPQLVGVRASSSLKNFAPTISSLDLSSSLNTASSFLFNVNSNLEAKTHNILSDKVDSQAGAKIGRRFLTYQVRKLNYAKAGTERKIDTEKQRKEKAKRKEANIVVHRQYRKGDFPDIQIPFSAVIDPLKMLAKRDDILARQLYAMLFSALINETSDSDKFIENFNRGILSIFNETYLYTANMIGAFLDASYENNKKKNTKKIYVDSEILSTVCKSSGLLSVGCLLMEEYINLADDSPSGSKKGMNFDAEVDYWVKLADMYKELNEWDAVIGIFFSRQVNCSPEIRTAITAEANCNWEEALKQYEISLNTDANLSRKDFYYESYFKCFANLSDWQAMSKSVCHLSEPTFWDGEWNQEKLLPWYMTAEMCVMLEGSAENTIINNLNEWMKDRGKSEYLKDRFSEELAVLSLLQDDAYGCKFYTKHCFRKFLDDWSQQNPLFPKIRLQKLLNFQKTVELNKFIMKPDDSMINYWLKNSNLASHSLPATEIRTLYRQQFIKSLERKISSDSENSVENLQDLKDLKLSSSLNLVAHSLQNKNYIVARKYCKNSQKYISSENCLAQFKLCFAMSNVGVLLAETLSGEDKMIQKLIDSWKNLDKICQKYVNRYTDLQINSARHIYKITQNIHKLLAKNSFPSHETTIKSLILSNINLLPDLQNYGINKLRTAIQMGEDLLKNSQNSKVLNSLIDSYMSLIIFAQNLENSEDSEMYHEDIIKYVLRAMKLGSKEARQIFPCLLQIPQLNENLLDLFKEETAAVPSWMYLLWLPQLFVALESCTDAVSDLVERLAINYPQALMYTYKLSREKYDLQTQTMNFKTIIKRLDNLLHSPLVDKFLFEISNICIPELYFNYHLEKVLQSSDDYFELKEALNKLTMDLKNKMEYCKHFKSIEVTLSTLENKMDEISNMEDAKIELSKVCEQNKRQLSAPKNTLIYYSLSLANFQAADWNSELEIPGQYSGESKPIVKYHAKISSFSPKVSCMKNSLRKPFKIIIFGNDSKEYPFLIKFGEDLRQDQRIQQLFSLANNILQSDFNCQQRSLCVEQYQVIPLAKSFGLIKMVEDTKSLSEFIYGTCPDQKTVEEYKRVQDEYLQWIRKPLSGVQAKNPEYYAKACMTYDENETNRMFTKLVNSIPRDILSKAFWNISIDTESYMYFRQQFITSYSTMCIVHWLLGIGDRNLSNCLVCQKTGRAVGIDFGYAFGTSTQHSLIPELIPFRLSPHILALMDPLQETGFVEYTMIHSLKALREKKHLLLSTMDVFIKDPSVDWLTYAKTQNGFDDSNWNPAQKVQVVAQKLNGANSAAVTVQELESGRINCPDVLNAYLRVLQKHKNFDGFTAEEQAKLLLQQATDYNILGRAFAGLELWI